MGPDEIKGTEAALKQHWKGLKIKSNNYPALLRKNIPTKGQDYTIPELGTALLSYAKEKGVPSWAELIKLNNSDPWSDLSKRIFNSEKYGSVLKKLAHLENAHFDSFLNVQLQKQQEGSEQAKDTPSEEASYGDPSAAREDVQAPKPGVDAARSGSTHSSGHEHARIPRAKSNTGGPEEDTTRIPDVGKGDKSPGPTNPEQAAPEGASPDQPLRSHNREQHHSDGGHAGDCHQPAASPTDVPEADRHEPAQAVPSPRSPVNETRSKTPVPSNRPDWSSPVYSPSRSTGEAPVGERPSGAGMFMDSPSRNTRSQTTPKPGSFGAGHKRANEDAFAEGSAQPAKKGPGSMRYPCPRPGGCPAEATNHIRKGTCEGCNFDIHSHTVARKKAEDEARKEKVPPLPVVLKAANREIERLHILGCSASLMVHTPKAATQTSQWFFASAGPKGKAYVDKHRGYFRKAMKHEGEGEAKVEESANLDGNSDDPTEKKTVKPTGASPANQFTLPPVLEDLVKGFADRYPETVIDTMLAALKKQYIDENTAKALDMRPLQEIFGKDMLGPCLRFISSVKEL